MVEHDRDQRVSREMLSERQSPTGHDKRLGFYLKGNENLLEKF